MKRLLTLMTGVIAITVVLAIPMNAAGFTFDYEQVDWSETLRFPPLIDAGGSPLLTGAWDGLIEISGGKYFYQSLGAWKHPVKYSEDTYDFFSGLFSTGGRYGYDCIWTGEYYVTRLAVNGLNGELYPTGMDIKALDTGRIPLKFYDKNFNLIQEKYFDVKGIPLMMEYYNSTYYCLVANSKERFVFSSVDTINWTLEEGIFIPMVIGNVANNFKSNYTSNHIKDSRIVSIAGNDFLEIVYERVHGRNGSWFGEWNYITDGKRMSFTNDGIYYIGVEIPEELETCKLIQIHEDESDIVAVMEGGTINVVQDQDGNYNNVISTNYFLVKTPKQPVYNELVRMKEAPYIVVNNKLLGLEQAPVMESDRTLVPMRFLFEQMGDSVSWDGTTQSATVQGKDDVVTFSIDNTTAKVNGENKAMDVPARLVNGKTMVPLRFLSEELGYTVEWDGNTRIITISTEEKLPHVQLSAWSQFWNDVAFRSKVDDLQLTFKDKAPQTIKPPQHHPIASPNQNE